MAVVSNGVINTGVATPSITWGGLDRAFVVQVVAATVVALIICQFLKMLCEQMGQGRRSQETQEGEPTGRQYRSDAMRSVSRDRRRNRNNVDISDMQTGL